MLLESTIAISAGELSGDQHAGNLLHALKQLSPAIRAVGMGGTNLARAGMTLTVDAERSASVMGFQELLSRAPQIILALSRMKAMLKRERPKLLILVDFPDFNLRLAKFAKELRIPVLYYISPKLWAWRASRVELIKQYVDRMAVIFPFEEQFYEQHGYKNALFVGHPSLDAAEVHRIVSIDRRAEFLRSAGLDPSAPVIAAFVGSRGYEIKRHLPLVLKAFTIIQSSVPNSQLLFAIPPNLHTPISLPNTGNIGVMKGNSMDVLRYSDIGMIKSGTSNLEACLAELPFVMFYLTSMISEILIRLLRENAATSEYSIVNLLRSGTVTELLQGKATSNNLAAEVLSLLKSTERRSSLKENLHKIKESLRYNGDLALFSGSNTAAERVAKLALSLVT